MVFFCLVIVTLREQLWWKCLCHYKLLWWWMYYFNYFLFHITIIIYSQILLYLVYLILLQFNTNIFTLLWYYIMSPINRTLIVAVYLLLFFLITFLTKMTQKTINNKYSLVNEWSQWLNLFSFIHLLVPLSLLARIHIPEFIIT